MTSRGRDRIKLGIASFYPHVSNLLQSSTLKHVVRAEQDMFYPMKHHGLAQKSLKYDLMEQSEAAQVF